MHHSKSQSHFSTISNIFKSTSEIPTPADSPCKLSTPGENIKVIVRIRPKIEREYDHSSPVFQVINNASIQTTIKNDVKQYTFDYVASEDSTQCDIFDKSAKNICDSVLEGYNGTIFVYGQTSSGKTYTILGPAYSSVPKDLNESILSLGSLTHSTTSSAAYKDDNRGILPRVFEYLFNKANTKYQDKNISFSCSFLEIYQEQLSDLLDPNLNKQLSIQTTNVYTSSVHGNTITVDNLSKLSIKSVDEGYSLIIKGNKLRHIAPTGMNKESSRSHAVFSIYVESKTKLPVGNHNKKNHSVKKSVFHLIDLAGSERQKGTEATGDRIKEAGMINKSLMNLSFVIKSLSEVSNGRAPMHIHYRDSKLTMLLKDSIGGNSKTCIIANISPSNQNISESLSTLAFAQRAKMIKNTAVVNEVKMSDSAMTIELDTLKEKYNSIKAENFYLLSLAKKIINSNKASNNINLTFKVTINKDTFNQRDFVTNLDSLEEDIDSIVYQIKSKENEINDSTIQRDLYRDQLQKLEIDLIIKEKEIKDNEEKTRLVTSATDDVQKQIIDYTNENSKLSQEMIELQSKSNNKTLQYHEEVVNVERISEECDKEIFAKKKEVNMIIEKRKETEGLIQQLHNEKDKIDDMIQQAKHKAIEKDDYFLLKTNEISEIKEAIEQIKLKKEDEDKKLLSLQKKINDIQTEGALAIKEYEDTILSLKNTVSDKNNNITQYKNNHTFLRNQIEQINQEITANELEYLNTNNSIKIYNNDISQLDKQKSDLSNEIERITQEYTKMQKQITFLTEEQKSTSSKVILLNKSKQENTKLKESLNEVSKSYDLLLKNIKCTSGNKDTINAVIEEFAKNKQVRTSQENIMNNTIQEIKSKLPKDVIEKNNAENINEQSLIESLNHYSIKQIKYQEAINKQIQIYKKEYEEKTNQIAYIKELYLLNSSLIKSDKEVIFKKENETQWMKTEIKIDRKTMLNSNVIKSEAHADMYRSFFGSKRKFADFIPCELMIDEPIRDIPIINRSPNRKRPNAISKLLNFGIGKVTEKKRSKTPLRRNAYGIQESNIHIQRLVLGGRRTHKKLNEQKKVWASSFINNEHSAFHKAKEYNNQFTTPRNKPHRVFKFYTAKHI